MKSLIKGTIAGLALGVALSSVAMAQTIRMGTEGAYPPYNFINDSGEIDGFERELGDEGRVVLRYSGTEPLCRVMVEAPAAATVDRHVAELVQIVREELGA